MHYGPPPGDDLIDTSAITVFDNIITDRGSKYSVSGIAVRSKKDALEAVKLLKKNKKYAKATHNSWAVILADGGPTKNDDGEAGAGMVIVRMLERAALTDHLVIVTRWFGGVQLGGDRFRRVQDAVHYYLENRDDGNDAF